MAQNPELEQAILADPDDEQAYLVYADWLQQHGDPRGELATAQAAEQRGREKQLLEQHHEQLLGELPDDEEAFEATWRHGWLRSVRINACEDHELPALYRALVACESARFLTELRIGLAVYADANEYHHFIAEVDELGLPFPLRSLYYADFSRDDSEISWSPLADTGVLLRRAPQLRELTLRGGSMILGAIDLPELRRFEVITGGFTAENIADVARARWPKLEKLHLYFGTESYGGSGGVEELKPILAGQGLPNLRDLGLKNSEFADALAEVLGKAPVLKQLTRLDLSLGTMSDEGAAALARDRAAFRHLEHVDLSENFIGDAALLRLEKLARKVDTRGQREADEYDGEVHRYVSVGE